MSSDETHAPLLDYGTHRKLPTSEFLCHSLQIVLRNMLTASEVDCLYCFFAVSL